MKLNMKRVALGLCMAACLFSLSACSKADTASEEIDPNIQAQMEQLPGSFLQMYTELQDEDVNEFKKQMEYQEQYAGLSEGADSWSNIKDDLGALVSIEETARVEEIEDGYTGTVEAAFEKRKLEFSVTTDRQMSKITSVSFVPEYTTAENMEKAALNTLMGMGTVFCVLIFISLLISCFKFIYNYETKLKAGSGSQPIAPPPVVREPSEQETENLLEDLELVAVITAAIAASTESSPGNLVVRSIRRAPASKWKKA